VSSFLYGATCCAPYNSACFILLSLDVHPNYPHRLSGNAGRRWRSTAGRLAHTEKIVYLIHCIISGTRKGGCERDVCDVAIYRTAGGCGAQSKPQTFTVGSLKSEKNSQEQTAIEIDWGCAHTQHNNNNNNRKKIEKRAMNGTCWCRRRPLGGGTGGG
jgi:hypothetical protein